MVPMCQRSATTFIAIWILQTVLGQEDSLDMWDFSKSHSAANETSRILHHVWFSKNVMMVLGTLGVVDKRTRIGKPEWRPHPAKQKITWCACVFLSVLQTLGKYQTGHSSSQMKHKILPVVS